MKKLFLAVVMTVFALGSWAQSSEFDKEIAKTFELMKYRETTIESLESSFQSFVAQGMMSQDKLKDFSKEFVDLMLPELKTGISQIYKETFTLDELKKLNEWLASPLGQKSVNLTPKAAEVGAKLGQSPEFQGKMQQLMMKYFAK
ncbi:MAG: DUF2059 domain-containing protein [Bacteroidales bacterium]|jgi:hypothetical protein|nr:DUF2059 domain-containing protein [Bacteroidales bacterium]